MTTMTKRVDLLDHGYLGFVESWGSDERIVEAARMSTDKGFLGWGTLCVAHERPFESCEDCLADDAARRLGSKPGDEKLLRYLWENKHATPFEMAGMTIVVQAPIMVFREWHRHRTQSYNELSARYTPLPALDYIPTVERLMIGSDGKNKQAGTVKDAEVLTVEGAEAFREALREVYATNEILYQEALKRGVPKELARVHLPVGRYSRMMASTDLRNWLAFLTLRADAKAQWEIRQYAHAVGALIAEAFPRTWTLFAETRPST